MRKPRLNGDLWVHFFSGRFAAAPSPRRSGQPVARRNGRNALLSSSGKLGAPSALHFFAPYSITSEIQMPQTAVIAAVRTAELLAVTTVLAFYGSLLWYLNGRFLKKLDRIFCRQSLDQPTLGEVQRTLEEISLDSAHFIFTMERYANIPFRQKEVILVFGRVGTRSRGGIRGPLWRLAKTTYALAHNSQTEWMKSNADVFRPAMSGYDYSVFWVNLDALIAG
jgi:hypothetical protein